MAISHPKMSEITRDFLSCSVCLDPFTDPRQLPCLHTFCLKCIQGFVKDIKQGGSFECPQCRSETQFPAGGPDEFKKNFFVSGLLEVMPLDKDTQVYCDVCQDNEPATSVCVQCTDKLCQLCANHHHRSKHTRDHRILCLDEYRSGIYLDELRAHQQSFCSEHKKEEIKLYCLNCTVPVCLMCKALNHEKHTMKTLQDAGYEADQTLLQQVTALKEKRKVLTSAITMHEVITADINCTREETLKELNAWAEQQQIKINALKNMATKETKEIATKTIASNHSDLSKLRAMLTKIDNSIMYTEQLTDHAKDIEKLQQYGEVAKKLQQLMNENLACPSYKPVLTLKGTEQQLQSLQVTCILEMLPHNQALEVKPQEFNPRKPAYNLEQPFIADAAAGKELFIHRETAQNQRQRYGQSFQGLSLGYLKREKLILIRNYQTEEFCIYTRQGKCNYHEQRANVQQNRGLVKSVPGDITVDRNDNILAVNSNGIYAYGVYLEQIQLAQFTNCNFKSITTNSANEIIVAHENGVVYNYGKYSNDRQSLNRNLTQATHLKVQARNHLGYVFVKVAQILHCNQAWLVTAVTKDNIVAVDKQQNFLYILNKKGKILNKHVLTKKPQGRSSRRWEEAAEEPDSSILHACTDTLEHVIVLYECNVYFLSSSGQKIECHLEGLTNPVAVAVGEPGELVVVQNDGKVKIYEYMNRSNNETEDNYIFEKG